jgi:putative ABC transport system permease protein
MYVPYAQDANWSSLSFAIRTGPEATTLIGPVREAIRSVEKGAPIYNLKTMNDIVATSAAPRRSPMLLLSAFAGVAMLLAMLGIYGVTAYYVTQRTSEIGVRIALGAQAVDVLKLVLRRGIWLAAIGVGLGLAASLALTRYMSSLLFQVAAVDLITYAGVAIALIGAALIASYIPARRATKVDPLVALRYE